MTPEISWLDGFRLDVDFGYVSSNHVAAGHHGPRLVLNEDGQSVSHTLVSELKASTAFTFSVAFISAGGLAQLKQHLAEFEGTGCIVTSDFLGFNNPKAFAELLLLGDQLNIDVRLHKASGFHPKGYVFDHDHHVTAVIGSSNLTNNALAANHEWNLRVSAVHGSDLSNQFTALLERQIADSVPLTQEWIDTYAATYVDPPTKQQGVVPGEVALPVTTGIQPNLMQQDALLELDLIRASGAQRAIIISATGTGKTILSALDVRAAKPARFLFVVHREQILDRTIREYHRVLGGNLDDYGKLAGTSKQSDRRYVFATIQTLSQSHVLQSISPSAFNYITIDEAHRSGAESYRRVIEHFTPDFLLGMTATPERTDGFNVFELFHYNVPYEIRLNHALEEGMLSPFHYYGVADVTYDDGTSIEGDEELSVLISSDRVAHLVSTLELYAQAGEDPRGLIFCSRKEEAHALSQALNNSEFRGRMLKTIALTGDDAVTYREQRVADLEAGDLDYILTVDIFNEGVDIPSVNQVVMLRQTQSAIVFVQQLGRGLRLSPHKDYLVVIDFIGNYATNFLIPIALFGDQSLNKESLRESLNEAVAGTPLPGLSSVSFDEVSRERVLASIAQNQLDSLANLKHALRAMQRRVGGVPTLWDFYRFESVDPVLLATKKSHFPDLVAALLQVPTQLSADESRWLHQISHEVLTAKRLHEIALMKLLMSQPTATSAEIMSAFAAAGLPASELTVRTAIDTVAMRGYPQADLKRYGAGLAYATDDSVTLHPEVASALQTPDSRFGQEVRDLLKTGSELIPARYDSQRPFSPGMQYTRRDAARILGWPRSKQVTIFGYKTDAEQGVAALFVTLHKATDVTASQAYEDALLDLTTMRWFSKSKRTLDSPDVAPIANGDVVAHVFVKKDHAEGLEHYYLGSAMAEDAVQTTILANGKSLPIVRMTLRFQEPVKQGLFDYFGLTEAGPVQPA